MGVAAVSGALLVVAQSSRSGLDDADPARQRPGFLDSGALPQAAPILTTGLPRPEHRSVAFFVGPDGLDRLCRSLSGQRLSGSPDVVVVVSGPGVCPDLATVEDPQLALSRAYGLAPTRSGAGPVGYAIVDRRGQIRYRTLDPTVADHLGEVATILRATP